jgi:hypothetical protein
MSMPFQFPDPSVQSRITHPVTGEVWVFDDGVWQVEEPPTPMPTFVPTPTPTTLEDEILSLRQEINTLQTDIIGLRAQLTAATVNNFLILE